MQTSISTDTGTDTDSEQLILQQQQEIERLRQQLEKCCRQEIDWLSPLEIEKISEYSAYQIRSAIDRAIESKDSRFTERLHYKRRRVGKQYRYHVNWNLVETMI